MVRVMRLALICTEKLPVPPIRGGAVQLYIDGILPYLSRHHQVSVFSIADPDLPERESDGVVEHLRMPARSTREYTAAISATIASERRRFDIIHVFNRPKWISQLATDLKANNTRFTLSLHNDMFTADKITHDEAEACLRTVSAVAAVSEYIKGRVLELYPSAGCKIRTVYSGADTDLFRPVWDPDARLLRREVRSRLGIAEHAPVILSLGRLSPKKGVHVLLDALPLILRDHPQAALIIVGSKWYGMNESSPYTARLESAAANFPGHVFFTGFIPPFDVARYYAAADVFVCASQWAEPLARVHYEAMASGLPIITTDRGGNAEVVRGFGTGWIVADARDSAEFARLTSLVVKHPDQARAMGEIGRKMAEERFNWRRVAGAVEKLFEDATAGSVIENAGEVVG